MTRRIKLRRSEAPRTPTGHVTIYAKEDGTVVQREPDGTETPLADGEGGGASTAAEVAFTPAGTIAATNVQAAIEEVALGAGATVGARLSIIGPFTVTFATPDIDEGVKLADLTTGTLVLRVWAFINTAFDDDAKLTVGVGAVDPGPPDDDYDSALIVKGLATPTNPGRQGEAGQQLIEGSISDYGSRIFRVVAPGGSLAAYVNQSPTTGSADIYALVVLP